MSVGNDALNNLQAGMQRADTYIVEAAHSASVIGSGSVPVLATPWLIAYMEQTAHRLVAATLPERYTSVGTQVTMEHLSPTPVGGKVTVEARVEKVDGRRIVLTIEAHDELEEIGRAHHQRMAIKTARFLERLANKKTI